MKLFSLVVIGVVSLFVISDSTAQRTDHRNQTSGPRSLSLAQRIAYQHAIEEVFWRHRIWPKENSEPKPTLDEVMPAAQLERKVRNSLRNSQTWEEHRDRSITAGQLQVEMDRMAQHTKAPKILRELFGALGNDPFVIAECLARPALSEGLPPESHAHGPRPEWRTEPFESGKAKAITTYTLPTILSVTGGCSDDTWTPTSNTNAPSAREYHTAVWTGSEMIIWGGSPAFVNTGGRYTPATDSWTATSTVNAPSGRDSHTAVWTGSEMIVWGGNSGNGFLTTGGRYNPAIDSWAATNDVNPPRPRSGHTAVWTGSEMIVWGGYSFGPANTGGRYNPSTDSWTETRIVNAPTARYGHTAVWTGSEMIVWGGSDFSYSTNTGGSLNSGGRYNPGTDSWTATSNVDAPSPRRIDVVVWTGNEMIVWGGYGGPFLNSGGRYNPVTDSWAATSTVNAPSPRSVPTGIWTGNEMIIWGGINSGISLDSGGRYNPFTDSWEPTASVNAPSARNYHTAVWTGSEMIVWGGEDGSTALDTGGRYCAQQPTLAVSSAVSRKAHGAAGPFDIHLPLTGTPGIECRFGGATGDYMMVVTFNSSVTMTGSPQAQVTAGDATIGSAGADNGGTVGVDGNEVTIPLTNVANAQTIQITLNGVDNGGGPADVIIPMSRLLGDTTGDGAVSAADISQTKAQSGQMTSGSNFRTDVNVDGSITSPDISLVKSSSGTSLP